MVEIKWQRENDSFKIVGTDPYEIVFDDISDDLRIGTSVSYTIQELWETEVWSEQGIYKILQTEFILRAWTDSNGEIHLVVGEYDTEDGYIHFEAFGYLDLRTRSVSDTYVLDGILRKLSAIIRSVSAPVLFNATVRLKENLSHDSLTLDSVLVYLPSQNQSSNPHARIIAEHANKQITSNFFVSEDGSVSIRTLEDAARYKLALYDSQKVLDYIDECVPTEDVLIELNLVPEPDNDYDPEAIAIALPRSYGESLAHRKIGYLYVHERGLLLGGLLNELAQHTDGEFTCYGIVDRSELGEQNIYVLLPYLGAFEDEARELLASDYLAEVSGKQRSQSHSRTDNLRPQALNLITSFHENVERGPIELSTGDIDSVGIRSVIVIDSRTKQPVGSVYSGLLLLDDERRREELSSIVREAGIHFASPAEEYRVFVSDEYQITDEFIPNIGVRVYTRYIAFETNLKVDSGHRLLLAEYNRATNNLWVQDEAIAPLLCRYASRLGLKVANVRSPVTPWWLTEQVHFAERRDYSGKYSDIADENKHREIAGSPRTIRESASEYMVREQYIQARNILFPDHELFGDLTSCRICGADALTFNVEFSTHNLAYCQGCLERATTGVHEQDRTLVLASVKELSEIEFAGEPPLPAQLRQINALGRRRINPHEIDRMLELRSKFRASEWSWTQLLADGGLIDGGLRTARGTIIPARDGHLCHSLYEKAVDDFLHHHGIAHEREPLYPYDSLLNPNERRRADWKLVDGTFVEMWGLMNDPTYGMKMNEKMTLAKRHNLPLIGITPDQIVNLPTIFREWLDNVP